MKRIPTCPDCMRRLLVYAIRSILDSDNLATAILTNPQRFVRTQKARDHFRKCIAKVLGDVVIDLNAEVEELGEDFDYGTNFVTRSGSPT